MSLGDVIAHEAEAFLAHRDHDYRVVIEHASSYDWFYLRVYYRGNQIARWSCCRRFWLARLRVRRTIRQHRKLVALANREGAAT